MTKRAHFTLGVTLALTLTASAAALAGPMNGRTYKGSAPASGIENEGHHRIPLHAGGTISLYVSSNGRTVTVHFSSSSPVLYCRTQQQLHVQSTRPAQISGSGSFRATVVQRFKAGPGSPAITQVLSGHFSGGYVYGTITTNQPECGGVASFSARA